MGSPRYRCGFRNCAFSTDNIDELAAHDVATGHPNPGGDPFAPALERVQELCASVGGHEPSFMDPGVCGVCGAAMLTATCGRHVCRAAGCDYRTDDPGAWAVHDVTVHGLQEVAPVAPERLRRLLHQSMCNTRGHIPNPINPAACLACGASLEVLRG